MDALKAAKRADLIPDIPIATLDDLGLAQYPPETVLDARLCSFRRSGCFAYEDIVHLPRNRWALNFDDGPLPPSQTLYDFLDVEKKKVWNLACLLGCAHGFLSGHSFLGKSKVEYFRIS